MERFFQAAACALLAVVMSMALEKQNKDLSMAVTLAAVTLVLFIAVSYFQPVVEFARRLQSAGKLDTQLSGILFKAAGISLLAEMAALICTDAGNATLAKGIRVAATAAVLWLSLPLMSRLLDFVQKMMGEA